MKFHLPVGDDVTEDDQSGDVGHLERVEETAATNGDDVTESGSDQCQ